MGQQPPVTARRTDTRYEFELPPQIESGELDVRVGDYVKAMRVELMLRPELKSLLAEVKLPDYLGRSEVLKKDVRGGAIAESGHFIPEEAPDELAALIPAGASR